MKWNKNVLYSNTSPLGKISIKINTFNRKEHTFQTMSVVGKINKNAWQIYIEEANNKKLSEDLIIARVLRE